MGIEPMTVALLEQRAADCAKKPRMREFQRHWLMNFCRGDRKIKHTRRATEGHAFDSNLLPKQISITGDTTKVD